MVETTSFREASSDEGWWTEETKISSLQGGLQEGGRGKEDGAEKRQESFFLLSVQIPNSIWFFSACHQDQLFGETVGTEITRMVKVEWNFQMWALNGLFLGSKGKDPAWLLTLASSNEKELDEDQVHLKTKENIKLLFPDQKVPELAVWVSLTSTHVTPTVFFFFLLLLPRYHHYMSSCYCLT